MSKLKIAIQKNGRLNKNSILLLKEAGIKFSNDNGKLVAESSNFPIQVLYLRDDDIPQYVDRNVADVGIVGWNVLAESEKDLNIIENLGFSTCRLSLAVPKGENYQGIDYFEGRSIATSYPNILSKYLKQNNVQANIEYISGSVEVAPSIGLSEGICDIVSTGSTLLSNGLKEVQTIFESEAVLVAPKKLDAEKQKILDQLLFRIQAVRKAKENKYILLNTPNDKIDKMIEILPGMNSPTVMPLAKDGWSSLHSVIAENQFWEIIEELKANGAEGILVSSIEKMIL